jgi:hypothetical protein
MQKRIFNGASNGPPHVPIVAFGTHWLRWVIIHATLRARNAAFCESLCGGFDVVVVAGQSASFHHSRNHTGWF